MTLTTPKTTIIVANVIFGVVKVIYAVIVVCPF